MEITTAQVRAAHVALGLDPDLTLSVSLSPTWAHVVTAQVDEGGHPIVSGGVLQTVDHGIQLTEEAE